MSSPSRPRHEPPAPLPPASGPPWVRVIIVNYNGGSYLRPCIAALARQTASDFEAVIVDNASTDGSAQELRLPDGRFTLVRSDANIGFAAANNLAARDCACPWIATLNPDTEARPDWLAEMRRGTERYPDARMFGATLVSAADPAIVDGFGDAMSIFGIPWRTAQGQPVATLPDYDCDTFSACAAAALYERQTFDAVGGFDERFFCYLEDVDLAFRLRLRGERCVQLRHAIVAHHGSAIAGHMSAFTIFHSFRNRLWMLKKNMPLPLLLMSVPANLAFSTLQIIAARRQLPVRDAFRGLWCGLVGWPGWFAERLSVQGQRRLPTSRLARQLIWNSWTDSPAKSTEQGLPAPRHGISGGSSPRACGP